MPELKIVDDVLNEALAIALEEAFKGFTANVKKTKLSGDFVFENYASMRDDIDAAIKKAGLEIVVVSHMLERITGSHEDLERQHSAEIEAVAASWGYPRKEGD